MLCVFKSFPLTIEDIFLLIHPNKLSCVRTSPCLTPFDYHNGKAVCRVVGMSLAERSSHMTSEKLNYGCTYRSFGSSRWYDLIYLKEGSSSDCNKRYVCRSQRITLFPLTETMFAQLFAVFDDRYVTSTHGLLKNNHIKRQVKYDILLIWRKNVYNVLFNERCAINSIDDEWIPYFETVIGYNFNSRVWQYLFSHIEKVCGRWDKCCIRRIELVYE